MLLLGVLVWWLVAGGVCGGELGGADSWLLMVEAGRDGPGRRITPKSVFIAPAIVPRAERCKPGFRYDHLGRCVKVVRIDPQAQLELLLKRLQGTQTPRPPTKPMPSSGGPLQFSLPLGGFVPEPETTQIVPTETATTTTTTVMHETTSPQPTTPTTIFDAPTQLTTTMATPTTEDVAETTSTPNVETTTAINIIPREVETKDIPTTTESPSSVTWWEDIIQTTTNKPTLNLETFTNFEGSGSTKIEEEGSGESSTVEGSGFKTTETTESTFSIKVEGSGSESTEATVSTTDLAEEDREVRSTVSTPEISTTEPDWPDSKSGEHKPIPPNDTTASLLLSILKRVEVQKSSESGEIETNSSEKNATSDKAEQLPIIEYINLVLPSKKEKEDKEEQDGEDRVLIPLDDIKFNISTEDDSPAAISDPPAQQKQEEMPSTTPRTYHSEYTSQVVHHPPWPNWLQPPKKNPDRTFPKVESVPNKFMDNWWTETLPFNPAWVHFPDDGYHEGPGNRKGPLPSSKERISYPFTPPPLSHSRFRFPEEAVDPAHRPVILKFWSRIPMLRGESVTRRQLESEEDQWAGP